MLPIGLVIIGVLSRLVIHEPNFTPVLAIALFAGIYLSKKYAVIVPMLCFVIVDIILGLHSLILFTWGSMLCIALIGIYFKNNVSWKNIALGSLSSAFLFFVVTNFGVWLMFNTYPKTLEGLVNCYVMAIPYFRNTLLSTLLYSFVMIGSYEFLASYIKKTRFAYVV